MGTLDKNASYGGAGGGVDRKLRVKWSKPKPKLRIVLGAEPITAACGRHIADDIPMSDRA